MKKLAAIILMLVYFAFSIGASVRLHYCMGKYAGFSLGIAKKEVCSRCGMQQQVKESGCCRDVLVTLKISDPYSSASLADLPETPSSIVLFYLPQTTIPVVLASTIFISAQQPPPIASLPPLYLQYRTFRI